MEKVIARQYYRISTTFRQLATVSTRKCTVSHITNDFQVWVFKDGSYIKANHGLHQMQDLIIGQIAL